MFLVHQKKGLQGKWEVAWMWLPHFLAADRELHKLVDTELTKAFKGRQVEDLQKLSSEMHNKLLELIQLRHPIPGLRRFLEGYLFLRPEEPSVVPQPSSPSGQTTTLPSSSPSLT